MFKKKEGTGQLIHQVQQSMLFGGIRPIPPTRNMDDEVSEVIASFNAFILKGEDPGKFPGFVRMRFKPEVLQRAEPYIRSMIQKGRAYAYVEAGHVPCDDMAKGIKKAFLPPNRVIMAPKCQTCVFNSNGYCNKVQTKLSTVVSALDEDVAATANAILARGYVPADVLDHALSVMDKAGMDNGTQLQKLHKLAKVWRVKQTIGSRSDYSLEEQHVAGLTSSLAGGDTHIPYVDIETKDSRAVQESLHPNEVEVRLSSVPEAGYLPSYVGESPDSKLAPNLENDETYSMDQLLQEHKEKKKSAFIRFDV